MEFRAFLLEDYPLVAKFWKKYYQFSGRDEYPLMKIFLEKNPGLSTILIENDEIIGTCLGSFDGRKGYLQKVVIRPDFQGKGLGKEIVKHTLKKLEKAGALDLRVGCSKDLVLFYEKCGFIIDKIIPMKIKKY